MIASKALKLFRYSDNDQNRTMQQTALVGFFRGISEGSITMGQDWPIDIILNKTTITAVEHFAILEEVFASGMLCQGKLLTNVRQR